MKLLVLNSGSSSIKYRLFLLDSMAVLRTGVVERIGEPGPAAVRDHGEGFGRVMADLSGSGTIGDPAGLFGIGHRVVHGVSVSGSRCGWIPEPSMRYGR